MSNETKRDVFDKLLSEYVDDELRIDGLVYEPDQHIGKLSREYFTNSYEAALPDNLPVIPKEVGEYIKHWKDDLLTEPLFVIFLTIQHNINKDNPLDFKAENWIIDHGDTFARASSQRLCRTAYANKKMQIVNSIKLMCRSSLIVWLQLLN